MNTKQAKRIKKQIYGDMSPLDRKYVGRKHKVTRKIVDNKGIPIVVKSISTQVWNDPKGLRAKYLMAKNAYKQGRK